MPGVRYFRRLIPVLHHFSASSYRPELWTGFNMYTEINTYKTSDKSLWMMCCSLVSINLPEECNPTIPGFHHQPLCLYRRVIFLYLELDYIKFCHLAHEYKNTKVEEYVGTHTISKLSCSQFYWHTTTICWLPYSKYFLLFNVANL